MNARESVTTLKFDGRLEGTVGSSTDIGKERFLTLLGHELRNMDKKPSTMQKILITR
jgi:hypothetical protein